MFAVETLLGYEDSPDVEAKRRLAQQQQEAARQAQAKAPTAAQHSQPSAIHQALCQPQPMSRSGSSSVLGNIFQGFVRKASSTPGSHTPAFTPPRIPTPAANTEQQKKDMEALVAEMQRQRDTDIVSGT